MVNLFERLIRVGTLTVIDADGKTHVFGGAEGPTATMRLHDKALHKSIFRKPQLAVGEAYMDGTLTVEEGTLYDLLDILGLNLGDIDRKLLPANSEALSALFRRAQQDNTLEVAQRNSDYHYSISDELFELFLDKELQYTCGYYISDNDSLEVAQINKMRHLAAKLLLEPGLKVLDIGSGWGGLAIYLARNTGADVTGVTLSPGHQRAARERAKAEGLAGQVRFHLRDYREEPDSYDRVVAVGMFEHIGADHYVEFFTKMKELLKPDGICLVHTIGRKDGPSSTNPWMRKYIFPGGYTPSLSELAAAVEKTGLWVTDVEVWRMHYAETLKEWNRRFQANRDKAKALYDERFCRMWEFYLQSCEVAFRRLGQLNFQVQVTNEPDAAPLTRDYITDWERSHTSAASAAE